MNRKLSISNIALLSVGILSVACQTQAQIPIKPNVIYVYADDMGKGMLSAYGQRHFTTPNIDALVARGTSFENAYGCMLSAPARASLLTGYHDCRSDKWLITGGGKFIPPTDNLSLIPAIEKEMGGICNSRDR